METEATERPDPIALHDRWAAPIRHYLARLTQDERLAEDLLQETFLRALKGLPSFRGEGEISNWLYRIATNLFRDHLRARRASGAPERASDDAEGGDDAVLAVPDPGPSLPDRLEHRAVSLCVRDCLEELPPPYRAALLLFSIEGKTVAECSAILGCSIEAVKVRLHRARRLFKVLAAERCDIDGNGGCEPKTRAEGRKP